MNSLTTLNSKRQTGLIVVLFTLSLVTLLGFGALAIDVNHVILNKSRIQNAMDSSALSAAVVADSHKSNADIANAALEAFGSFLEQSGNSELFDIIQTMEEFSGTGSTFLKILGEDDSFSFRVELSNNPTVFPQSSFARTTEAGELNDIYVRVQVTNIPLDGFLIGLFDIQKQVSASAVAGPSSSVTKKGNLCNLVPLAVCAVDAVNKETGGYNDGDLKVLKETSWDDSDFNTPGNFQLLNYDGVNNVEQQLAGGFDGCLESSKVKTKTGNSLGLMDGLNTRFGEYKNLKELDYPHDIYLKEGVVDVIDDELISDFTLSDYKVAIGSNLADEYYDETGEPNRRQLPIPIVDCASGVKSGGVVEFDVVASGCFFLISKAPTNNKDKNEVYGEFNFDCLANNITFPTTPSTFGAHKIQLYQDVSN